MRDAKAGKLEYRTDRGANVHVSIGKKSFAERQLVENYAALIDEIVRAKPAAAKGRYIRQITLTTTMGPGIHVDTQKTRGIVDELEEMKRTGSGLAQTARRQRQLAGVRLEDARSPAEADRWKRLTPPFSEPACVRARFVRGGE